MYSGLQCNTTKVYEASRRENTSFIDNASFLGISEYPDIRKEFIFNSCNDLQPYALALCPTIGELLEVISLTNPLFTRMSGTGSCCFGVFYTQDEALISLRKIKKLKKRWWLCISEVKF